MDKIVKIKKIIKSYYSMIFVICAFIFCISTILHAAYTDTNYVPKTVTVHEDPGLLFTSNYLEPFSDENGSDIVLKTFSVTKPNDIGTLADQTFNVYLRNYNTNDKTTYLGKDLEYKLEAKLVKLGDAGYAELSQEEKEALHVANKHYLFGETDLTVTDYSQGNLKLETGGAHEHTYSVTIDKEHLTNADHKYFIKVTAAPTTSDPNIRNISAIIGLSWEYVEKKSDWIGKFTDDAAEPKLLDGFNYIITGYGTGTGTLVWDPEYLELDEYCDGTPDVANGKATLTLTLDDSEKSKYVLRFHRTGTIDNNESWVKNETLKVGLKKGENTLLEFTFAESSGS